MSDWFTETNDWRKQAAMTAVNDLDIEKAVYDQATGFVENKLAPLMKGDHPLGFEIVKKNDDNTRIVGVFAFKIDKSLLFAPVFFINGEIKGPLLYRCDTKTFVPANKEWAEYLISSREMTEGKGRDRSMRFQNPPLVQMQRIAWLPSGMGKKASAEDAEEAAAALEQEQKEVPVKEVKVKATKITGKYTVRSMDRDKEQPETTVGTLKVASYDDGSVRMCFNNEGEEEFLTQDGAYELQNKSAATIQCGGDGIVLGEEGTSILKQAFLTDVESPATAAIYNALLERADYLDKSASLLKGLLADPVYGSKATDVILKVASGSEDFTEQLARLCDGKAEELFSPRMQKQAAAETPALALVYDQDCMSKEAAVSKEYFRDGFFVQDTRPEETLSVVYETSPDNISAPTTAGEYAVVTNEGKLEKGVFVGKRYVGKLGADSEDGRVHPIDDSVGGVYAEYNPWRSQEADTSYVLIRDKRALCANNVLAIPEREVAMSDAPVSDVRAGKAYMMLTDNGNTLIGPIVIKSVRETDGVKYCQAYYRTDYSAWRAFGEIYLDPTADRPMTINPEAKTNLNDMVIGPETKFVEVEMEARHPDSDGAKTLAEAMRDEGKFACFKIKPLDMRVGSAASVDNFIFNQFSVPKVKIKKVLFGEEDTTPKFAIEAFDKQSAAMPKSCMMVKLARDMNISATQVYDIMDKVATNGEHTFYVEGLNKTAAQLHLVDSLQFDEKFNSEFGVPIEPTKVYHLRTQGIQMFEPPSHIGDAMNPTTATGLPDLTVATTAPEDLRALADTYSLPNVFDHAAVGTLADAFNAMSLMNRYIPAIEDAVDAMGRIKFLFYWLPEDFEKAYGQDDMINIEAQIDAQFNALGSLLIKLLKKSDALKKSDGTENSIKDKE